MAKLSNLSLNQVMVYSATLIKQLICSTKIKARLLLSTLPIHQLEILIKFESLLEMSTCAQHPLIGGRLFSLHTIMAFIYQTLNKNLVKIGVNFTLSVTLWRNSKFESLQKGILQV